MMYSPASAPFVIQSFLPSRIHSSPCLVALVWSPNASEPDPASESAYAPTTSLARRGRYRCLMSSEAHLRKRALTSVFWTSTKIAVDASTADSSSTARTLIMRLPPAPPCCSPISMPISPSSKNCASRTGSSAAARSIAATRGRTSRSANSRTVWRKSSSSAVSRVSGDGGAVVASGMVIESISLAAPGPPLTASYRLLPPLVHHPPDPSACVIRDVQGAVGPLGEAHRAVLGLEPVGERLVAARRRAVRERYEHDAVPSLGQRRAIPRAVERDESAAPVARRELVTRVEQQTVRRPVAGECEQRRFFLGAAPDLLAVAAVLGCKH